MFILFFCRAKYAVQSIKKKFGHENAHVILSSLQVEKRTGKFCFFLLRWFSVWNQL